MDVSLVLLNLCFLLLMGLGVYTVLKAITNPPKGGTSQLGFLGSRVTLKGPAWLVMIVVGALMIAAPILAAVVEQEASAPFVLPAPAKEVRTLADPDHTSFVFLRDVSFLDLRNSLPKRWHARAWAKITGAKMRPTTLLNYMVIRKVGNPATIRVNYGTSKVLDARCVTHPFSAEWAKKDGGQVTALEIDIRSVPPDGEFTLINEVTYWDAFSGETGDNFTTYTHDQATPEDVAVVVAFPEERPYRTVHILETPPNSDPRPYAGQGRHWEGVERTTYYWSTTSNSTGPWYYTAHWTW